MLWVKTFHVLFVVSWFAGLFYLPRIYVNLAQANDPKVHDVLLGMAQRLYRFMTPLAVLAVALGIWLWLGYGIGRGSGWLHAKLACVLGLVLFHLACGHYLKSFAQHANRQTHRYFRVFNELPVLLLVATLVLVIVKPF